jgi:signal transduction histidine kinase
LSAVRAPSGRRRWLAALLLGAAGWLLNLFPVAMTPGIDLLFGGIPAVLAAATLGPLAGLLAGAVAASLTVWLWDHPYALLIFSLEALTIGWLVRRGRRPLAASAIFWLALGVPVLAATYGGIMGVRGTTAAVLLLKQPFNGLLNAMVVEVLLLLPLLRRWLGVRGRPPLRVAVASVMGITAVVPALLFGVWTGRSEWRRNLEQTEERLTLAARAHAARLEQYVGMHEREIRSLAQAAGETGRLDPGDLRAPVRASRQQFPGFIRVQVADASGVTVAGEPAVMPNGVATVGVDLSDRPYAREVLRRRETVVTDVATGRLAPGTAAIVIASPVLVRDSVAGLVVAVLDLGVVPAPEPPPGERERLRVADRRGGIVYDSRAPYAPGEAPRSVADSAVYAAISATRGPTAVVYSPGDVRSAAAREVARTMAGVAPIPALGWLVWSERPLSAVQAFVAEAYLRLLALLIAVTVGAVALSNVLAALLTRPLLRIRSAATALAGGERRARVGRMHPAAPLELAELGGDFDVMADALAGHTAELEELSEIARSLAGTLEPDRVLDQVTGAAARLVRADGCTLGLLDEPEREGDGTVRVVAASGLSPHEPGTRLVLRAGELATPAGGEGARGSDGHAASVPLRLGGETLGVLAAYRGAASFSREEIRLLGALAGHAAVALRNARLIEESQAAVRARSQFIATVSHELRTPLNAVLGHLQILDMEIHGPLGDAQRDAVRRIDRASRHLRGLIEEVLSFERLEAGRVELRTEEVDPCALARDVAAVIEPLAHEKALAVHVRCNGGVPPLRTDPDRVRQILINLAGNAVKFTDAGEVRIEIAGEPGEVVISVHDTGPGIRPEDRPRLFRPFEQLHAGFSRPHGGTGLGLYLSAEYARLLGGRIRVRTAPGEGSTFSLVLPAESSPEAGPPAAADAS